MKNLTIRWKFILSSFSVVLATIITILVFVAYTLHNNLENEIVQYRQTETEKAKENLKSYVDLAFGTVEKAFQATRTGNLSIEEAKIQAAEEIKHFRWDSGVGYLWINDTTEPVPKMIMHPAVPELNGKVLDDPKFNCALGKRKNLFVAMVDVCKIGSEGFVDYLWPKPTKDGLTKEQPKLSYVKLYEPFGWIIGTGKYIDDINGAIDIKEKQTDSLISKLTYSIAIISIALLLVSFFPLAIAARRIVEPIIQCIDFAGKVQKSDLSGFINVKSNDETKKLADALNNMVQTMRHILADVYQHSSLVVMVSDLLTDSSNTMSKTSTNVSTQAESVAASAEEVATNISSVSDSTNDLSRRSDNIASDTRRMAENVHSISTAIEELSSSFKSVAENCSDARRKADDNQQFSEQASRKINDLNEAAANIGNVISLIEEVTEQTKLLALNATIEAARAGDAGKGFSIVANEVKELAGQTANATETISARITEMQKRTEEVVKMIEEVSNNNRELNEINTSIASAVEEQSVTATDIATTVAGTAQGTEQISNEVNEVNGSIQKEISKNIREASLGVTDVSANIQQVNKGIRENAALAGGNHSYTKEMSVIASRLKESFAKFNLGEEKFDIGMIKAAHIAWKLKLKSMLNEGTVLSLDKIPDHSQCDFGKWLTTDEGQTLQSHKSYNDMIELHKSVHALANRVASSYLDGQKDKAVKLMGEFEQTSQDLFAILDRIHADRY